MKTTLIYKIFQYLMILVYFGLGLFLIFEKVNFFSENQNMIFGIILVFYSVYRIARLYYSKKSTTSQ